MPKKSVLLEVDHANESQWVFQRLIQILSFSPVPREASPVLLNSPLLYLLSCHNFNVHYFIYQRIMESAPRKESPSSVREGHVHGCTCNFIVRLNVQALNKDRLSEHRYQCRIDFKGQMFLNHKKNTVRARTDFYLPGSEIFISQIYFQIFYGPKYFCESL